MSKANNDAANVTKLSPGSGDYDKIVDKDEWAETCRIQKGVTKESVMKAIPDHCKERSYLTSSYYVLRDTLYCFLIFAVFFYGSKTSGISSWLAKSSLFPVVYWSLYAFAQGTAATGLWVVGHECGHGAFSPSQTVNDTVGYVIHTLLLVPFFAWQFTHGKHHKYTNHMVLGESHVPATKPMAMLIKLRKWGGEDAFACFDIFLHLFLGWPLYLIFNLSGGRENWKGDRLNKRKAIDHFQAINSEIFPPQWHTRIQLSALGMFFMVLGLGYWSYQLGFSHMFKWYLAPYLVVNAWLVLYTWLQHTHPDVPHFGKDSFTWLRGALCTIDRPYPAIIDHVHHHIGSTHVLHHLNSRIPHYHAQEASEAIKPLLGNLYRFDPKGIVEATFFASKKCNHVDGVEGLQWYKSVLDKKAKK